MLYEEIHTEFRLSVFPGSIWRHLDQEEQLEVESFDEVKRNFDISKHDHLLSSKIFMMKSEAVIFYIGAVLQQTVQSDDFEYVFVELISESLSGIYESSGNRRLWSNGFFHLWGGMDTAKLILVKRWLDELERHGIEGFDGDDFDAMRESLKWLRLNPDKVIQL